MADRKSVEGALNKIKAQQENFGFMDRLSVPEHWAAREVLESFLKENPETKSHSEKEIYSACVRLLFELVEDFAEWYRFVHGEDSIEELSDEEMFCVRYTPFKIVQELFLWNTRHGGGTSTRMKCDELGIEDPYKDIEFAFKRFDEE